MIEILWGQIESVFSLSGRGDFALILKFESDQPIRIGEEVRIERPDGSSIKTTVAGIDDGRIVRDGVAQPNVGLSFANRKLRLAKIVQGSKLYVVEDL